MFQIRNFIYVIACIVAVTARRGRCRPGKNCPELVDVVQKGNITTVKELLKTCDVDSVSSDNRTALHRAVGMGRPELVFLLLDRDADPRRPDPRGLTPLHLAANSSHAADVVETVTQLLLCDADRLARDDRGRLPLHFAARHGRLSAARLLLTACDPTCRLSQLQSRDAGLSTPEEYAGRYGHMRAAMWLQTVTREAAEMKVVNAENGMRVVPLNKPNCTAMVKVHSDINKLKILLRSCNVDSVNSNGMTALMQAIRTSADVTFTLLTYGANVNHADIITYNPLHRYVIKTECASIVLLHKPNRHHKGNDGGNALYYAAANNKITVARLLLSNCDAECKFRQLRSLSNNLKTPSEWAANTKMKTWLNQVHTEAAQERVMELKHGHRPQCEPNAGASNREKTDNVFEIRSQMDNIKQTLHRFIANIKALLNVTSETLQPKTANEYTTVPHTRA